MKTDLSWSWHQPCELMGQVLHEVSQRSRVLVTEREGRTGPCLWDALHLTTQQS